MNKTDKLDIADEMLASAIDNFLKHKRYFAALNDAGVAEEIYGKQLRILGVKDTQTETIEVAEKISEIQGAPEQPRKEWKKIATHDKNSIKHLDSRNDRYVNLDAEDEARFTIGEAVSNHMKLNRMLSPQIKAFNEAARQWAKENAHIDSL